MEEVDEQWAIIETRLRSTHGYTAYDEWLAATSQMAKHAPDALSTLSVGRKRPPCRPFTIPTRPY